MTEKPSNLQRLAELAADESLGQISVEDRAELEALREELGAQTEDENVLGDLLVAFDDAAGGTETMPTDLAARIVSRGRRVVGSPGAQAETPPAPLLFEPPSGSIAWRVVLVAAVVVAAVSATIAVIAVTNRARALESWNTEREVLLAKVESNETLLAQARTATEELRVALEDNKTLTQEERQQRLAAQEESLRLAERLASATSQIDSLAERVARYEEPADPAVLARNRQKLLEVPDTIRVAWQPFDLENNPAEQRTVRGDVVWNDDLEEGYLRFVGLEPNDPNIEQYQVWVIDERGMEQKVSGGVFNATADGEVIVPIVPGIDVHRVALFAVTIEEPGGTWVPDLKRRVVVAPVEG